ncbi:MAG TPA: universal stress protein [Dermatophilaceae bacterium]
MPPDREGPRSGPGGIGGRSSRAGCPDRCCRRSRDAQLLVVGSHGHSEIAQLLGSVSYHCVAHAACPVVVVRHRAS